MIGGEAGARGVSVEESRDAGLLGSLSRAAWAGTVDPRSSGHRLGDADVASLLAEGAIGLVARDATGVAVGSVLLLPGADATIEVSKLAVPEARNIGVGSLLLDHAADVARRRSARRLLLAVSLYTPTLVKYYARRGFTVTPGERYSHASPHSPLPIVMARPLDGSVSADPVGDAAAALERGSLAILPTETVYGLSALASNPVAVRRVFATKGRPADHPLIVHVADGSLMDEWARDIPDAARVLASKLWPGPLTLVLRRRDHVLDEVTGGLETVALRVPLHPVALAVLGSLERHAGLAAPSANRFGRVSPTTAQSARDELAALLAPGDAVLDGGPCRIGVESTILDLTTDTPTILRPGGVAAETIEHVLGRPVQRVASGPSRAPGMLASHYAPKAGVLLAEPTRIGAMLRAAADSGALVAALVPNDVDVPDEVARLVAPEVYDGDSLAPILYERLRDADRIGAAALVVMATSDTGLGSAVNDRLRRAAHGTTQSHE